MIQVSLYLPEDSILLDKITDRNVQILDDALGQPFNILHITFLSDLNQIKKRFTYNKLKEYVLYVTCDRS